MHTLHKDNLDLKVENDFYGLVSKKYLTYYFKNTTSVPTYVLEYLLGKH
jgi:predicted ATP-dependent Lon-type protease